MFKKECDVFIEGMEYEMKEVVKVFDFECVVEFCDVLLEIKVEGWSEIG